MSARYMITDDYGTAGGAGGSGETFVKEFTANTATDAKTAAFLFASAFQRPVRFLAIGDPGPGTLVTGALPTVALTTVPSGIGY